MQSKFSLLQFYFCCSVYFSGLPADLKWNKTKKKTNKNRRKHKQKQKETKFLLLHLYSGIFICLNTIQTSVYACTRSHLYL